MTEPDTGLHDPHAQLHLGVFLTGVGPQLIWADPSAEIGRAHV